MKFALVFPGQGSQQVGMLAELGEAFSTVRDTFSEASDALGLDLWQIVQDGPEEQLNQTDNTQPALLAAGVAIWRTWQEKGGAVPHFMAGHSLGEYTALTCAGSLSLADAVRLVQKRGQLMMQAVPAGEGKMAAIIGLEDHAIAQACKASADGAVVAPVNYNSPGQVVIAGNSAAVERAMAACKEAGAKRALPLAVSVPSHCLLMKPAAEALAEELTRINLISPSIAVINNVDAKAEVDPASIKDALVRQLYCPVRWVDSVQFLVEEGVEATLECGPGKVLGGLNRRIDKSLQCYALQDVDGLNKALES